jgi:hypothetical protein
MGRAYSASRRVDSISALRGTISGIYLAAALVELAFVTGWLRARPPG